MTPEHCHLVVVCAGLGIVEVFGWDYLKVLQQLFGLDKSMRVIASEAATLPSPSLATITLLISVSARHISLVAECAKNRWLWAGAGRVALNSFF